MFKCDSCVATFLRKDNLLRHKKTHFTTRIPCRSCDKTFKYSSDVRRHEKNAHAWIQLIPSIFVPNDQAGPSNQGESHIRHNILNILVHKQKNINFKLITIGMNIDISYI